MTAEHSCAPAHHRIFFTFPILSGESFKQQKLKVLSFFSRENLFELKTRASDTVLAERSTHMGSAQSYFERTKTVFRESESLICSAALGPDIAQPAAGKHGRAHVTFGQCLRLAGKLQRPCLHSAFVLSYVLLTSLGESRYFDFIGGKTNLRGA